MPRAKQVTDRFHLVQGLTKAVQEELAHQRRHLLIPAQQFVHNNAVEEPTIAVAEEVPSQQRGKTPSSRPEEIRQQRWQQKLELFGMVKGMHARGMKASEIVRATGISRGRVDKWLRLAECPPLRHKKVPRPGMAEYLHEELRQLWDQGCHTGKKLLDEIRKLGYIGSLTSLNRFLQPWREEKRAAQRKETAAAKSKKARLRCSGRAARFSARGSGGAEQTQGVAERAAGGSGANSMRDCI